MYRCPSAAFSRFIGFYHDSEYIVKAKMTLGHLELMFFQKKPIDFHLLLFLIVHITISHNDLLLFYVFFMKYPLKI